MSVLFCLVALGMIAYLKTANFYLSVSILHWRIYGKRARRRARRRWTDDIKDWTKKTVVECIQLVQDRHVWREFTIIVCGRRSSHMKLAKASKARPC